MRCGIDSGAMGRRGAPAGRKLGGRPPAAAPLGAGPSLRARRYDGGSGAAIGAREGDRGAGGQPGAGGWVVPDGNPSHTHPAPSGPTGPASRSLCRTRGVQRGTAGLPMWGLPSMTVPASPPLSCSCGRGVLVKGTPAVKYREGMPRPGVGERSALPLIPGAGSFLGPRRAQQCFAVSAVVGGDPWGGGRPRRGAHPLFNAQHSQQAQSCFSPEAAAPSPHLSHSLVPPFIPSQNRAWQPAWV